MNSKKTDFTLIRFLKDKCVMSLSVLWPGGRGWICRREENGGRFLNPS